VDAQSNKRHIWKIFRVYQDNAEQFHQLYYCLGSSFRLIFQWSLTNRNSKSVLKNAYNTIFEYWRNLWHRGVRKWVVPAPHLLHTTSTSASHQVGMASIACWSYDPDHGCAVRLNKMPFYSGDTCVLGLVS